MQREHVKPNEDSRFRILTEISQQITSILDINELLHKVARIIQDTFGYYHVGIGLIENDDVVYRVGAGILWDDPGFQFKPGRLKVGLQGITGWVARTGQPALLPDVANDPRYVWMQGSLTRSELTVPITVKGRILGVLDVQSQHLDDFEHSDVELMQAIASQTGVAMENARLFSESQALLKETEQRAHELAIINSVQQGLASKLDVQSIYDLVGDTFHKFFNAQVVMISTYDPQSDSIEHHYAIERGQRVYSPGRHPPGRAARHVLGREREQNHDGQHQQVLLRRRVEGEAEDDHRLRRNDARGTEIGEPAELGERPDHEELRRQGRHRQVEPLDPQARQPEDHPHDRRGQPLRRPGPWLRWAERHALVIALLGLAALAASGAVIGVRLWN